MGKALDAIISSNAPQSLVTNRYETGRIVSVGGGEVVLDVGAHLPDGTVQYLELPYADSFTPLVGQIAGIVYPNDDPNAAYVVAAAESAQYDSTAATPIEDLQTQIDALQVSSGSNYITLPGGITIQWGYLAAAGTITFPVAFANTNYYIVSGNTYPTSGTQHYGVTFYDRTASGCKAGCVMPLDWIAIGTV